MAISVNTNVMSLNAQRNLTKSQSSMAVAVQRLSSGLRVNSAKDDAAGLAIAERMTAQARGLTVAIRNSNDAVSLAQTAEGSLGAVTEALQRMRELAVQSANGTNSTTDRTSLNSEFAALGTEVGRILGATKFNGLAILAADAGAQTFQVGANTGDTLKVTTTKLTADAAITAATGDTISASAAAASAAIATVDAALDKVNTERATLGAAQSRLENTISALDVARENQYAAAGRIKDADFAAETANLTRGQILQQAGVAMVAQANQLPQLALSLLG